MRFYYSRLLAICFIMAMSCKQKQTTPGFLQVGTIQLENSRIGVYEIASHRKVPWELCWGPDEKLWFAEQEGRVYRLDPASGNIKLMLTVKDVWFKRTAGLLGMAVYKESNGVTNVFLAYTHQKDSSITSKLVRYQLEKDSLTAPKVLLEIPGNHSHNGSRIKFSEDGVLYWATGDAHVFTNAQDSTVLNGKILRINRDGAVPKDNPIPGSYVWAWGFRNMQGLTFDANARLYASEHGEATDDELNLLIPLKNYGWPHIEGYADTDKETLSRTVAPVMAWTPTIAPAALIYYNSNAIPEWTNSFLLGTLKDQSLRVLKLDTTGTALQNETILMQGVFGRIRSVTVATNGDVYLATSNRDWNPGAGFPLPSDDRILKLAITDQLKGDLLKPAKPAEASVKTGAGLYDQFCSSCHKADGKGIEGSFPALLNSQLVLQQPDLLIKTVLKGKNQMPAFAFLSDEELAMIVTHIRISWTNKASSITAAAIRTNRTN